MLKALAIGGRDLKSYLNSFSFYLLAAFFLGISGYFFWSNLSYFSLVCFQAAANPESQLIELNLMERVFSPFLANLGVLLLLMVPVLTMRSFVEEKKSGTLELLFTYPVSNVDIVFGKFLGALILVFILFVPTMTYYSMATVVGAKFEVNSVLTGYLGLALMSASFVSLGIFVSSLTENQAVSAGVGFTLLLFFWVGGWIADWSTPGAGRVFHELSLIDHFRDFSRGVIDTRDVAYFVLFTVFFLFSTFCSLEVRTWKR